MKEAKGVALIIALLILGALLHLNIEYVQGTEVGGPINVNTTWTLVGSPYIVVKDINVLSTVNLTIEPGVTVEFTTGTNLIISGGLFAQGDVTHPITFTSNSTTPTAGAWGSVWSSGKFFVMDFCVIKYAEKGLELDVSSGISNCVITNCNVGIEGNLTNANKISVTDNVGDGLSLDSTLHPGTLAENSNISSNGGYGILVASGSTLDLNYCTISNNAKDGVILSSGGTIGNSLIDSNIGNGTCILGPTTIKNTTISNNGGDGIRAKSNILITGCNITGNAKDGISCDHTDESMMLQRCHLSYNIGDGIWTNSSVEIDETDIIFNDGNGVIAAEDGSMTVSSSNILNNTLNGLTGRGYASTSNVTGNKLCGILGNFIVEYYSNVTWNTGGGFNGTGVINQSSIFSNTPYDAVADIWPNNITATNNWWGTNDSQIIREHIHDWYNDSNLGYVFYSPWLSNPPTPNDTVPPEINVTWKGTSPEPYDPKFTGGIRMNEPVGVSANVTDDKSPVPSGVDKVFISYRVDGGEWWRTAMTRNETSGYWVVIVPGQQGDSTVEFLIDAYDKNGNHATSPSYSYEVKKLPIGDINGDGSVDMADISIAIDHFMQTTP